MFLSPYLTQLEFHGDVDNDVNRDTVTFGRREFPLAHGFDGFLLESTAQRPAHLHVADRAIAAHDNLEHDVAFDRLTSRGIRVARTNFPDQRRWVDAGARLIRTATGTATRPGSDAAAVS